MRKLVSLALATIFGVAGSAQAAPLSLKQVSAGAKWLAQVDVDAAHGSLVVKNARNEFLKQHPGAEVVLAGIKDVWKFDPQTDLHGLTFYGEQLKNDNGVVLVHAKRDEAISNRLVEKAKAAPDHQVTTYGKYELHSWTHDKGARHERSMTGAFYGSDIVVFGLSVDAVKAALDVLDGTKPSLEGTDSPLAATVPPGAILVARAINVSEAELPHKHPLAKQIDTLSLVVGEYKGDSFLDAKLTVKKPELAQQMKSVIEGARGIFLIVHSDDPEGVKLVSPLKVAAEGNLLSVEWRASAELVWARAQKMCEQMKTHRERRAHMRPRHRAEEDQDREMD
ncbi:MAG: hypothetical protein LLG00_13575 [Planctomycetaceae bacterium]|nr:hypothetical protein [Planctomycetaceae bacterium]